MSYKTYESYKDSGIIWANEIPNHWVINKLKRIFQFEKGRNAQTYTEEYINSTEGFFPVYSGQTKNDGILGYINTFEYDFDNNVILVTTVGAKAMTIFRINGKLSLSQNCALIKLKSYEDISDYYYYLCKILFNYERELIPDIMQPSLRIGDLNTYNILQPPNDEQLKIANYLDKKTSEIDENIAKNKELISLLEEKKTALINQVVTKGLDPNVPLKDSGIDWIGEIPEHWRTEKLKFCTNMINDKKDFAESNDNYVGLEHIESKSGKLLGFSNEGADGSVNKFKANMVLFSKLRPYLAKVILTSFEGVCSTELLVFQTKNHMLPNFLFYVLLSNRFIEFINSSTYGVKMPRASPEFINNSFIIVPPLYDQERIIRFLNDEILKINNTAAKILDNIDLLEEYKTSLIHHVVTGKINVIGKI